MIVWMLFIANPVIIDVKSHNKKWLRSNKKVTRIQPCGGDARFSLKTRVYLCLGSRTKGLMINYLDLSLSLKISKKVGLK